MLDEFRPMTVTDVAKKVGVDPFEVIRLLVAAKAVPEGLVFTADHVERLRSVLAKR